MDRALTSTYGQRMTIIGLLAFAVLMGIREHPAAVLAGIGTIFWIVKRARKACA
jgi:hypothetical protein